MPYLGYKYANFNETNVRMDPTLFVAKFSGIVI